MGVGVLKFVGLLASRNFVVRTTVLVLRLVSCTWFRFLTSMCFTLSTRGVVKGDMWLSCWRLRMGDWLSTLLTWLKLIRLWLVLVVATCSSRRLGLRWCSALQRTLAENAVRPLSCCLFGTPWRTRFETTVMPPNACPTIVPLVS